MNDQQRPGEETYPIEGSIGHRVYQCTEAELDDWLQPVDEVQGRAEMDLAEVQLRSLRPERLIGRKRWVHPGQKWLVEAQIPPLEETPVMVTVATLLGEDENPFTTVEDWGFPLPDADPSFIVGRRGESGKKTAYFPGPEGLARLVYIAQGEEYPLSLSVWSEAPSEPEFSRQVKDDREHFSWEGTLRFSDLKAVREKREAEEHIPPGSVRARAIL